MTDSKTEKQFYYNTPYAGIREYWLKKGNKKRLNQYLEAMSNGEASSLSPEQMANVMEAHGKASPLRYTNVAESKPHPVATYQDKMAAVLANAAYAIDLRKFKKNNDLRNIVINSLPEFVNKNYSEGEANYVVNKKLSSPRKVKRYLNSHINDIVENKTYSQPSIQKKSQILDTYDKKKPIMNVLLDGTTMVA